MKTLVKVNAVTGEITMTKATAQKARSIGSTEYEQLAQATKDFPNFKIRVSSPKAKAKSDKGLTMPLMKKLIHVMADKGKDETFEMLVKEFDKTNFHFSKPKAYFLSKYPNWREWLPQVEKRQTEPETEIENLPQEIRVEKTGLFHRKSV